MSQLDGFGVPIYVALGLYEPNPAIAKYVPMFVSELQARGKNVESRLDYPGDHKWFWTVRDEYWGDTDLSAGCDIRRSGSGVLSYFPYDDPVFCDPVAELAQRDSQASRRFYLNASRFFQGQLNRLFLF